MVSALFGYMREYRNPRQIKSDGGRVETLSCRRDTDASGANRTKGFRLLLHDGASAWKYAAATLERHQVHGRFHRPAKDRATRNRSTQRVRHIPVAAPTGERGIIFALVKKPNNVAKYVRRIKEKAGIEKDFTYHSAHHSVATLAITVGTELYSVSKILGHGSIVFTLV